MKKLITIWIIPVAIIFLVIGSLFAGTTGKIAGTIKDKEDNPLAGVNVIVEGTTLGAASDINGNYYILNIPPGVYTIRATMMGYKTQRLENIHVIIDMTTKANFVLEETVLGVGEEVTIVAKRPLVRMDMTSSMASVSSQEIADMPVQTVSELVELQAGVIRAGGLHIRGGRNGEIAYWVDGIATTDVFNGSSAANIENAAVEELQVISGTFNAEYGQAMSGIINIITKDGGPNYHGEVKGYIGDYYSTSDIYRVLDKTEVVEDPETGRIDVKEYSSYPLKDFNPIYNGELSLNGPVPFLGEKLTFLTNVRYDKREGFYYGREWFLPSGVPGDRSIVPLRPSERYSVFGKLLWKITPEIKLRYSINYAKSWRDRNTGQSYKYVPGSSNKSFGHTISQLLSLNHILSPTTFYELKISRLYKQSESYLYDDPFAQPGYRWKVIDDTLNTVTYYDPVADKDLIAEFKRDVERYKLKLEVDPANPIGYVAPDSSRDPAAYSFKRAGNDLDRNYRNTSYWIAKFDLTSQLNNTHQFKTGLELRLHEINKDNYTLQPAIDPVSGVQEVPFKPSIPDISSIHRDKFTRKPREFSAYIQDKMELKDIIFNIGLRFDYFDANSFIPADPEDPSIYKPLKREHKYKNPEAEDSLLVERTIDELRDIMHKKVDPKMQLSPRLGIAYPITDKGVIHFSYGHFFQMPEFQYMYNGADFKVSDNPRIFGNPDLNAQRTTQYEIGLQQQIGNDIGIDVSLFYRDVRDWVGTSPVIKTARTGIAYVLYENKDYSNVRGITVKAEKRFSHNFYTKFDYTYQVAEGTYSNPRDAFIALQARREPVVALLPLDWDQRHTLHAQFIYRLNGWTASMIGRFKTGLPYTPSFVKGTRVGGGQISGLKNNSARRPTITSVDVRITKEIRIGALDITLFAYVYNLLDQRSVTNVFSDTGSPAYTTNPTLEDIPFNPGRIGTTRDLYTRPGNYIAPREINIGLSFGF